ncbi:glutamyl-queuosine tRNA(Asp) synthetase [Methylophilaceae bacterium 11]|nr:glutamyl-queuosine tRNA(Asp) synthetase [Methylophilaceae bacterium 11]
MSSYVGRFAPSPTGPLHFGSLVAAVASYCDARANQGQWLVRIEDLDKPREVKGAAQDILHCLEAYGFSWDGEVIYQSKQTAHYAIALQQLQAWVYPCTCTRKEIADSSTRQGIEGFIYPGTCLHHPIKPQAPVAWRVKTQDFVDDFHDNIQGALHQQLATDIGDFVLKRADGLFAYQLAVVVDDAMQGVTHVVRGADLLYSTSRQRYLQQLLQLPTLNYAHIPIVMNADGEKLSKQTLAPAILANDASTQLLNALAFLKQTPPASLHNATLATIWAWAIAHWDIHKITA